MIDFYEVIKASEGIAVADEFATLWGRKISGGYVISTYTGTLPATLRTVAGYLEGYKIYGNPSGCGVKVDITGLSEPLCGIDTYSDVLELSTGTLTRQIKKLVFDGTESWTAYKSGANTFFYTSVVSSGRTGPQYIISSHFVGANISTNSTNIGVQILQAQLRIRPENVASTTTSDFKSFLAAQYAAGTPVTVWYVLAEPEISTVSVPSGLTGTIEGYLIYDGVPTPETPIYPTANGVKQADGTYSIQYGYKLPILSNSTITDIYIGDTALGKDEYVDGETGQIYRYVDGALVPTDPPVPLPQIPTFAGETTISYGGAGAQPEKVELKYRK